MRWEMSDPTGNRISCGRMVDTATHPDFQRLGIFRRLTMEVLEECRVSGVQLLFNTPNSQSRPGYLSMGWNEVGAIGVMLRPSLTMWRRDPALDDVLPEATTLDPPLLAWRDRPADGLRTPRSPEYLSWRYTGHPFAPYVGAGDAKGEVVARLNHRRGRRELVVSDLFGNARSALRSLIGEAEADYAVAWFSKGSPERSVSIGTGLVPLPGVTALHLVANPLVDLDLDVFDLATWDLSLGDLELL